MALINWNDNYSVNVAEIDEQHKELIAIINELGDALKSGKGVDISSSIVNRLAKYAMVHFKAEEALLAKFGYTEMEDHKKEHAAFVRKVVDFRGGLEKGKLSLSMEIMIYLSEWMKNHILVVDKKYSQFLNEKGVK